MKPSIPKGTRDFLPHEVLRQNFIFDTIRSVYERHGYQPIETPAMENLSTLTGKYGEEGDKLLFKVLNNGDFLAKADQTALQELNSNKVVSSISKRGLRYDLTVPFARFVVMHQNELQLPFKRYQIQPVWRADRPQKGRYQEFYQCDADVVGSDSLMLEAEYVTMIDEVFAHLGLQVEIKMNNRKILAGIAEVTGISDKMVAMTVAVDKLDKIGWDGVSKELGKSEISEEQIGSLKQLYETQDLDTLANLLSNSEEGMQGITEMREVFSYLEGVNLQQEVSFDSTLARGLSYYTGCIFEVKSKEVNIGSILGGGRYADLTGVFGLPNVSGVGISFGVARIFDVMQELDRFPIGIDQQVSAMIVALDGASHKWAFKMLQVLHKEKIACTLYPDATKLKKQMKYANATSVPYVILVGSQEVESQTYTLKHMQTGEQWNLRIEDIVSKLKEE